MASTSNNSSPWTQPESTEPQTGLMVYNSMTKSKVPFVPREGNYVSWYGCGPTDYFNYDVNLVMNITDIDDKIIERARHTHLFKQYRAKAVALSESAISDVDSAFKAFVESKLKVEISSDEDWKAFVAKTGDGKDPGLVEGKASATEAQALVDASQDVLALWLDKKFGAEVTDPQIFRDLAAYWEKDFFEDMDALNVRRPHVLTRVSEFVPEIVQFVQRIIENGYAYEADGSVYFDVASFDGKNGHFYAKLEPKSKGNAELLADGEGSLGAKLSGKRSQSDFALWKASKPGEPAWPSPWGPGRPGWHIECSVMASEILGQNIDMHTGGIDLAFPHHDNELAQSEACFDNEQWVNYFMHAGHLHIEGLKMSKSLKNFITIKEALAKYTARQIRIIFVLSRWDSPSYFKENSMHEAMAVEKTFDNFFSNTTALLRDYRVRAQESDGKRHFLEAEHELLGALKETKAQVHAALKDSFDTPTAMRSLQEIVNRTNVYLQRGRSAIDPQIVEMVALYVTKIVRAFGLVAETPGQLGPADRESVLLPVATALSDFRDAVREIALAGGDKKAILALCDKLRDDDLPELGIVIDDHGDGRALVKFADPEELRREKAARQAAEDEKRARKEAAARAAEAKRQERLAKGKLAPKDMFKTPQNLELYSEWDGKGIPTKDKAGEDLAKGKLKKLAKEYAAQEKLHTEYLKSLE
ncbi:hypothetical protein DL89DRAFT_273494 [Linderina pennispora]|uniref:cysteine--tRNA ligase n=1 Tax=Linderina pennispora TaxID=61395 RepID=A0A1Y1WJ51_9FUNG|nr:cysteine--tRNA ligase [Linderina pennispora]ORX73569.1 hypothetical protein DL89DRAFT_273494 [Linderina pennispora]